MLFRSQTTLGMTDTETQNNGMPTLSPVNLESEAPKTNGKTAPEEDDDDDPDTDRDGYGFDQALAFQKPPERRRSHHKRP